MHTPKHRRKLILATNAERRLIEKIIYLAAFLYPLTTLPQIIQIFSTQNAHSVSLLTWVLYMFFTFVFLLYALVEKLKPLIIEYILWLAVEAAVVVGILLYR